MPEIDSHGLSLENISPQSLRDKFRQAEKALKTIELFDDEIVIPTINQLRYVGYHLSKYVLDVEDHSQLVKAAFHCERATFDAFEAGISYLSGLFRMFDEDFEDVAIASVVPDISGYRREFNDILTFVVEHNNSEDRHSYYSDCLAHYNRLKEIVDDLEYSRDDLVALKNQQKHMYWILNLTLLAVVIIGVTTIAVMVIIAITNGP